MSVFLCVKISLLQYVSFVVQIAQYITLN